MATKHQSAARPAPWEEMQPRNSSTRIALEVLRNTLEGQWENLPSAVQEQIVQKIPEFEFEPQQKSKIANKMDYTPWLDRILRTMTAGERVENLLKDFLQRLEQLIEAGKSDALFALLLEQVEDDKGRQTMRLLDKTLHFINAGHWQSFGKTLHELGSSLFFQNCLEQKNDQEVVLARYVEHYHNELDDLVKESIARSHQQVTKGMAIVDRFWLSSLALASDYAPARCILIVYANTGDEVRLVPPQCATEELRILQFLRIAYNQINYRIRDLPKFVHTQRRAWIRELAPSVLAHEAAASIQIISDSAIQSNQAMLRLMQERPDLQVHLAGAAKLGGNVLTGASNLLRTFSTYLNLQRKSRIEEFSIGTAFEEAWELCKQRLNGIEVAVEEDTTTRLVQTDRVLLTLVFTNLLTNAARAINEGKWPDGLAQRDKKIYLFAGKQDEKQLHLLLANSGPPIPSPLSGKIFVQGYSTFADGHGQGLFVCRLICQHLGGNLFLAESGDYADEFNVAFDIVIDPKLTQIGGDGDE